MKFELENGEKEGKEKKIKEPRKFGTYLASYHSKTHSNKMIMNSLSCL